MIKHLIVAGACLLATPALADELDFVLINQSGKEITKVEMAPAGSTTFVASRQNEGRATSVRPGARMTVYFERSGQTCSFDLKATFKDSTSATWSRINVCDNAFVTLRMDANGATSFSGG